MKLAASGAALRDALKHQLENIFTKFKPTYVLGGGRAAAMGIPLLELLKRKRLIETEEFDKARDQLDHLGRMLTNLVKAHE